MFTLAYNIQQGIFSQLKQRCTFSKGNQYLGSYEYILFLHVSVSQYVSISHLHHEIYFS